tara:strand:+ start:2030 stop:2605 length:576 start_codon:yes stop_codon:yes gene_type:complete
VKKIEIISAILGDAVLPLVGFLFWNWGFYFIVLFFLFDLVIRTLFLNKRIGLMPSIILPKAFFLKGIGLVVLEVWFLHLLVYFSFNSISFITEIWGFLTYKELGFAQGIILLPLLFLNEIIRIRNEKKLGIPQNVRFEILKNYQFSGLLRVLLWSFLFLLTFLFSISETTLVSILILTLCIQPFWIYRNIS